MVSFHGVVSIRASSHEPQYVLALAFSTKKGGSLANCRKGNYLYMFGRTVRSFFVDKDAM
jgi:hypothetical protein